jgi:hypothetical protein
MFTDHHKAIGIGKVGDGPYKKPDNGEKAQDIKYKGGALPSEHDLVGEDEEVKTDG